MLGRSCEVTPGEPDIPGLMAHDLRSGIELHCWRRLSPDPAPDHARSGLERAPGTAERTGCTMERSRSHAALAWGGAAAAMERACSALERSRLAVDRSAVAKQRRDVGDAA